LIGNEIVNAMVAGRIAAKDCCDGFMLDGYPRTVAQARFFTRLIEQRALPDPMVIHLDVPTETLVTRLTARRQCPKCLRLYNVISHPPLQTGRCDEDGATLATRDDDCERAIRERMHAYAEQTGPVLDWFGETLVRRVDASLSPGEVSAQIERIVIRPAVHSSAG
jgi:adenylate kinase